jgi:cardiolipin synthase C
MRIPRSILAAALLVCLAGCASFIPGSRYPRTPSAAAIAAPPTSLQSRFEPLTRGHGTQSGFRILTLGIEGFLARIELIDAAEKTLDLQYYIFRGDETGSLVREALERAAARGVRIRVLVDDSDTRPGDEQLFSLANLPNVEIRVYNPWIYRGHLKLLRNVEFLVRKPRLDYRMHNKLLVADDAVALVGGRNVGDQYFQVDPQSQFADDDVFVAGSTVQGLEGRFDEFWNSPIAIPTGALGRPHASATHREDRKPHLTDSMLEQAGFHYREKLAAGEPLASLLKDPHALSWADARIVSDSPEKKEVREGARAGSLMYKPIADAVGSVERELLMITPYFVPSKGEMQLLLGARSRGARVATLTNSLQSAPQAAAHAGYMHYRPALLRAGVELFEVRPNLESVRGSGQSARVSQSGNYALHGKLMVFDRRRIYIGSMNFDRRSRFLNTEIGLIIDSPELSAQTVSRFDAMTQPASAYRVLPRAGTSGDSMQLTWTTSEHGHTVVYEKEPARSSWQRLKVHMLSMLPVDPEL